jgi:hypothetical protein
MDKRISAGRYTNSYNRGQLSEEVRVAKGVPQRSALGPLVFLVCVNDIWKKVESTIRIFADDGIIYRNILSKKDVENLQMDLNRLRE